MAKQESEVTQILEGKYNHTALTTKQDERSWVDPSDGAQEQPDVLSTKIVVADREQPSARDHSRNWK